MRRKTKHDKTESNRKNSEMKYTVRKKECMVDERWSESLSRNFREKKKLFGRKSVRKERVMTKWRCESGMWMGIC